MKKIKLSALTVFFFTTFLALAEIRETIDMALVPNEATPGTVMVFDIDNTILAPAQSLGSDQWYDSMVKDYVKQGLTEIEAVDKAIVTWVSVQKVTQVKPIESITPGLIGDLQKRGIRVFALTARPTDLAPASIAQLKSIGIDMQKTSQLKEGSSVSGTEGTLVKGGIIFVGPKNNKGAILGKLLESEKSKPTKVVFTDDKVKHVTNVEKALAELKIPYLGFRYGAADSAVKNFDAELARKQLAEFQRSGKLK